MLTKVFYTLGYCLILTPALPKPYFVSVSSVNSGNAKMQSNKERNGRPSKTNPLKRLRSVTKFPRKDSSFIIAFALHETYDNIAVQENICCSQSSDPSDHTITPKGSTSNYGTGEMEQKQNDSDFPDTPLRAGCDRDEGGDLEQKLSSLEDCIIVKKIADKSEESQLAFGITGHSKRPKHRTTNRQNKSKYLNKVKVVNNKRKDSKKMNKKICKHINLDTISNKIHSESISKMLLRTEVLQKVSAKEGFIEDQHLKITNDNDSMTASFITANPSFFSYSSQDTLTYKESNSNVRNSDFDVSKAESASSVIHILPDETFKTVINVSRAMIQSGTFGAEHNVRTLPSSSTVVMSQNLTSTETLINPVALTSDPSESSSKFICDSYINSIVSDISAERLTTDERISTTEASDDDDTYYNAKTSSYFKKSDKESNSETTLQTERPDAEFKETFAKVDPYSTPTLMDRVINLGMFPEITPHNSNDYSNDVIITGKLNHNYTHAKEEQPVCYNQNNVNRIMAKNIAQKPFCPELSVGYIRPKTELKLMGETTITDILQGNGKYENLTRKDDLNTNHPSNLSELWEKLLIALDSTAKKIEESLSDRIIKEMRVTLNGFNKSNALKDVEAGFIPMSAVTNSGDTDVAVRLVCPEEAPIKMEHGLQCDLVQNQPIDDLMLKYRSESAKVCPAVSHQNNPKLLKSSFEILKPPGVSSTPDRGDVVTLTDEETVAGPSVKVTHMTYPSFLKIPVIWQFLRDNVFVLTSVPLFFAVFVLFYFFIVSLTQPL